MLGKRPLSLWTLMLLLLVLTACVVRTPQNNQSANGPPPPSGGGGGDCRQQCRNLVSCGAIGSNEVSVCTDACNANDQGYMSERRSRCNR